MVVPLGGMGQEEEQDVPEKIKDYHFVWWYMVSALFIITTVGCLVALKIFDALIALMIGIWAYYLTKDKCKNMTQQCLFSFGLMCCIQGVMELIILAMSLPGRRTQTTTPAAGGAAPTAGHRGGMFGHGGGMMGGGGAGSAGSSSYTVTILTSPFFSEEQGWHYNLQSAMMIAGPVCFILGAIMAKISYSQYPNSLFAGDAAESSSISGGGGGRYGSAPANSFGGGQRLGGAPANSLSGGGGVQNFGGSGQRLGSA